MYVGITMTKEAIISEAKELETTHDLLVLLNKIKMAELGDKGHPFIMPHLNFFIHPARNKRNYKSFYIPKKSGGVRKISAPTSMLKSFLTYTNKLLQAFYEAPEYITGFVPGKSVVDNAEIHIGKNYVFNTDLKDFFPSISKSRVWATLKHPPFNFNDTIADAIAGLCCTEMKIEGKKCWALPQGSPCSPIITNIVCKTLDRRLYGLAKKFKLRYSRYADDITFSGNKNVFKKVGTFQQELERIINTQHFTINDKKTRLQKKSQRQEVTGLVVSDRVNVTKEYIRGIDNILYIWEKYGETEAYTRFLINYTPKIAHHKHKPNMRFILQGKLHYLKMVKGADNEVWRRLQRRFNKLVGAKSVTETAQIKYKYLISDFEKKANTQLQFDEDKNGILHCYFIINGSRTTVNLSKYARTRLTNLVSKQDTGAINKLKSSYLLIFYEDCNNSFWRIERKRSAVSTISISEFLALYGGETNSDDVAKINGDNEEPLSDNKEDNTDKILQELVSSDFDLKTLDGWNKIRSS